MDSWAVDTKPRCSSNAQMMVPVLPLPALQCMAATFFGFSSNQILTLSQINPNIGNGHGL